MEIHTDKRRVEQILLNLVSNAVKYTVHNGMIKVSVKEVGGGRLEFSVQDTGCGISPERQRELF